MKKWIRGHRVAVTWGLFGLSLAVLALALVLHAVVPNARPQPSVAVTPGRLTVTIEPTATLRITYLGDSLTAGLHAVEETDSFRSRTTEALASGGPVEEQATKIVGGTVRQTLEGNPDLPNDQDIYVVQLGTNDFNDGDYRAFQRDYGELLDRVRAASPDAALVCLGTWRPAEQASRWDLVIRGACEAHNGRYDRMSDLAADDTMVGPAGRDTFSGPSDDFHPNNAGHRAISDRLMAMVEVERIG